MSTAAIISTSTPALLNSGIYQVLFLWGVLAISILIVTVLLACTPLGRPLKRGFQHLCAARSRANEITSDKPTLRELEGHTFEFCSPQSPGTPALSYEWVLRLTPPPTAHLLAANDIAHVAPTLTHRFSDIPRATSGQGLGIHHAREDYAREKSASDAFSKEDFDNLRSSSSITSEATLHAFMSKPAQVSPSRPLCPLETGRNEVDPVTEGSERQKRRDRYRALLLQSNDEGTRRELLKNMPKADRIHCLTL